MSHTSSMIGNDGGRQAESPGTGICQIPTERRTGSNHETTSTVTCRSAPGPRASSYFRIIEIAGCLPDAVPFALTSASTGRVVKTLHAPFLPPPTWTPGPEIKSRIPFVPRRSCHTSLLIFQRLPVTTAFVASRFVLRHIVSPRRLRDTLNNIPPPADLDSRVVRCALF
ncbi:hypothetical protein BO78DRAFT_407238 [Aspergillus sclerotiicarbonarius CBS 121057]|uniref:Uncharacterized protein n=1 Tax=Aspergillus sclerotiicarbonarius (strain CBS 121057 / IBT 28362) TaxID=1448318 RepID=A0A319EFR1_ASPSB|nr:hypothetical protein BO78DRAFT_407238 [Aspergillus sclerotiicarbonarius CBS 121057]